MSFVVQMRNEYDVPMTLGPFLRVRLNGAFLEREDGHVLAQLIHGTWYAMDGERAFLALRSVEFGEVG